jgi:hypothetical protein
MSPRRRASPALRVVALSATGVVLFASAPDFRASPAFTAVTSCGPPGVMDLRDALDPGCGGYDPVHVASAAAVGLPEHGESKPADGAGPSEGPYLHRRTALYGPVSLPGASPPTTVTRLCHLARSAPGVLDVTCEGPDPESACTGTLTEAKQ